MCGINGLISDKLDQETQLRIVERMNARLAHRGPDNQGTWAGNSLCLGHTRLSIIDLSPESNQPFFSAEGRYVIVYNGELYNYRELKLELQRAAHGSGHQPYFFKTASDTEVIVAAYARWGIKCLNYFNGMFAFAIYDKTEKKLVLARDRAGVKPLYFYYGDEGFIFSSEIRGIIHSGIRKFSLNPALVAEYTMYQTVFAPNTIVKGIKMLMPGHYAEYAGGRADITRYHTFNKIGSAAEGLTYRETCAKVNELLSLSVQRRMIADVPFGAFLSGGIDSTAVVGLMSKVSSEPVSTFNVSFDESEFSESKYARIVAQKFNTRHHEIRLTAADFLRQLPEALHAMDHPSGDGPNTYIVSRATREAGITMALSGIGGDELFAGYDVFKRMSELQKKWWLNMIPQFMRKTAGYVIQKQRGSVSGNKIRELLGQSHINFLSAYPLSRSLFTLRELEKMFREPLPFENLSQLIKEVPQVQEHLLSAVSLAEFGTYLQNTLLRDTDQMSMAVALEVREPFLDHQLVEFVLGVNDEYKFPHSPKKLLVDSLGDLLPGEIVYRPKMGFVLPWEHWLRNELKIFCEGNLTELASRSFMEPGSIEGLWSRFLNGDPAISWSRIWHLVVLNKWISDNALD